MGRPVEYAEERTTTALRIPPELHGRLKVAATERGISTNRLILLAAEDFLARLIPVEEFTYTRPRVAAGEPAETAGNGRATSREATEQTGTPPPECKHPRGARTIVNAGLGIGRCGACGDTVKS